MTEICLTKLDVLDQLTEIKVCVGYKTKHGNLTEFPQDLDDFLTCTPIYETLPGWETDISDITSFQQLPQKAKDYINYVSEKVNVPIGMVSVGSKRRQTIHLLTV